MNKIENIQWSINEEEKTLCHKIKDYALSKGAKDIRINMNKSVMEQFIFLNAELDKVSHSADRSIILSLFVNGRYGSCSINKLEEKDLEDFVDKAINIISMLEEDNDRKLPKKDRYCKTAINGDELGLCDYNYSKLQYQERIDKALECSIYNELINNKSLNYRLISEEIAYSDSIYDNYIIDSQGLECRHIESSFELSIELTIEDSNANKYTGYAWNASCTWDELSSEGLTQKAIDRAVSQIEQRKITSGKYNMIVENEIASRLVTPLLSALNGSSIQQQNSFLLNSIDKKIFHEAFTLNDRPLDYGKNGARLFDNEGMSYNNSTIIENGIVKKYFINTYISEKLGVEATNEDCPRPMIMPFKAEGYKEKFGLNEILEYCKDGIYVTGFNGGNSNAASGDFSYGVEGFIIKNGKIDKAVRSMVITGNFIELWNNLLAAGDDYKECMSKQIPTLAFKDVSFSI